ncbi:MAG: pantetheine-phosphate adenylyltransferase [Prevotella sp.]
MIKAVFVGSFDPFTVGHYDIVQRALPLFDKLIIGVGVNERKVYMYDVEKRVADITRIFNTNPKVEVKTYKDLTVDFAKREDAKFIVKGVRSVKDFEYEREQADINRRISGIETLLLCADPQYSGVSSSVVRELIHFGRDVSEFLPK